MSLSWTVPAWMWPLLLILAAGAVIWTVSVYGRSRPHPPARLQRVLITLRSVALVLLVLAVAGPLLSRLQRQELPASLVFLVEDSGSMAIADGPGGGTRWGSALEFTATVDSALAARQWPGKAIYLRGNGIEPITEFRPDDPVVPDPQAHGTDLEQLLLQAADQLMDLPIRGRVLLTDGQETADSGSGRRVRNGAPGKATGRYPGDDQPLLVMGTGDPEGSADRLIRDLRYPENVFAGDEMIIEWTLSHRFLQGGELPPVTVSLSEGGQVLRDTTFVPSLETMGLEMPFSADAEGLRVLELSVSAIDNERFLANNTVSLGVNVQRGRSRVLLLADKPGWDLRFLAQAALDEPRIDLAVVYSTPAGPVFADSLNAWEPPLNSAGWQEWDAVILLGWQQLVRQVDWDVIGSAVAGGMGLLVMPGNDPPQLRQLAPPAAGLAALLPVKAERWRWIEGDFLTAAAVSGQSHPVLNDVLEEGLGSLPPLRRMVGVTAGPQAVVLLQAAGRNRGSESPAIPLLVTGDTRQGKTAWFGGQRLWELAFWNLGTRAEAPAGEENQAARMVLQNLLVWLAADVDDFGLNFSGRRPLFHEGEKITIGAQWRDMRGLPVTGRQVQLVLKDTDAGAQDDTERSFALAPVPGQSGLWQVDIPPLPPGSYSVQLLGQGQPEVTGPTEYLVVTAHSLEQTQVRQDGRRLEQLAARRSGTYLSLNQGQALDQALEVLDQIDWSPELRESRSRWDFWSGWPFLVLVVMLLGAEWYLRRRNGLL